MYILLFRFFEFNFGQSDDANQPANFVEIVGNEGDCIKTSKSLIIFDEK